MIRQIIHTLGTKFTVATLNLLLAIVISQILGPEGKGEQSLILATISLLIVVTSVIGQGALVYLLPRHSHISLLLPSFFWTVLVGFISYVSLPYVNINKPEHIHHIAVLLILLSVTGLNQSVLLSQKRITPNNLVHLAQVLSTVCTVLILFFALNQRSVMSYIYALYVGYGVSSVASFLLVRKSYSGIVNTSLNEFTHGISQLWKFGKYNQLATFTQLLSFRVSYYFINHYFGEAEVGIFSNGIAITESIWIISRSLSVVQQSWIVNSKSKRYSRLLTLKVAKAAFLVSMLIMIPIFLFPPGFYRFVFGEGFGNTQGVIQSLAVGIIAYNYSIIISHYFSGTGQHHINAIASTIGLIVNIITAIIFIPMYSYIGAGISCTIAYFATTVVKTMYFIRQTKIGYSHLFPTLNELKLIPEMIRQLRP